MPRVSGSPPAPPVAAPAVPEGAAPAATAGLAPSSFSEGIDPRPQPIAGYGSTFASYTHWNTLEVSASAGTGGPQIPAIAEAGKPFTVSYHKSLADLGLGGDLKTVTLHYKVDGGPVRKKVIADGQRDLQSGQLVRLPAKIDLPATARGEVEYWFVLESKDGQQTYDSDFGKNYRADIVPAGGAVVKFDDLWGDAVSGPIKAGETLRIAYDVDRVKQFLWGVNHHGVPTWSVSAFVSFDGKPATELPIAVPQRGQFGSTSDMIPVEVAIEVPADAKKVDLWFRGSSYGGSQFGGPAWDSNFGSNYSFPVVS